MRRKVTGFDNPLAIELWADQVDTQRTAKGVGTGRVQRG